MAAADLGEELIGRSKQNGTLVLPKPGRAANRGGRPGGERPQAQPSCPGSRRDIAEAEARRNPPLADALRGTRYPGHQLWSSGRLAEMRSGRDRIT